MPSLPRHPTEDPAGIAQPARSAHPDRSAHADRAAQAARSGRSRGVRLLAAAVAAVCLGLSGCSSGSGSDQEGFITGSRSLTQIAPEERKPAPVASGPGLDGGAVTTEHPGKVVVINVWGSWCNPCRAEAPDLEGSWQDTKDVAQFVGIDTRDPDPAPAQAFTRSFGITYPSIYDPRGETLLRFAGELPLSGIPSTLVIDPQGRTAARVIDRIDRKTLTALVRDTAAGR